MYKIVLCGGGTAGHILPLLAVATELKKQSPAAIELIYIGEKDSRFKALLADAPFDSVKYIPAGKFRRYHKQNWLLRLLDVGTILLNIRDLFRFIKGLFASYRFMRRLRPNTVFIKGGFVGVPVGFAATRLKIPYVTHDSDALPGLANRLIAKRATLHATGLPQQYYAYPKAKTRFVGVPVRAEFRPVGPKLQHKYRSDLKIPKEAKVILIIGGSLGAVRMNNFVAQIAQKLLVNNKNLILLHSTGINTKNFYAFLPEDLRKRTIEQQFLSPLYKYSGAADLIVTRAGATSMAEFAMQRKPCIIIPNPQLTGGHQSKNAEAYKNEGAGIVIGETELKQSNGEVLYQQVNALLNSKEKRQALAHNIAKFAKEGSSKELAQILLQIVENSSSGEV